MDTVSSGSDEGYIESMIATADSSRGDAKDPDADFSAVLHEVPIEIRRRLAVHRVWYHGAGHGFRRVGFL